ncbi:hypothetical protein H2203_002940 [Taxawa tesnikishii (nom. ined.)]|nr:hypothetical protein H2203_002940 [Dothideales sp. JES 119]
MAQPSRQSRAIPKNRQEGSYQHHYRTHKAGFPTDPADAAPDAPDQFEAATAEVTFLQDAVAIYWNGSELRPVCLDHDQSHASGMDPLDGLRSPTHTADQTATSSTLFTGTPTEAAKDGAVELPNYPTMIYHPGHRL